MDSLHILHPQSTTYTIRVKHVRTVTFQHALSVAIAAQFYCYLTKIFDYRIHEDIKNRNKMK